MKRKSFVFLNALALTGAWLASCAPTSDIPTIAVYQDMSEAKIGQLSVKIAGVYDNASYSPKAKGYRSRIVFRFANAGEGELKFTVKDVSFTSDDDGIKYKFEGLPESEKLEANMSVLVVSSALTPTPLGECHYSLSATIDATKYVVHLYNKPDSQREEFSVAYKVGDATVHTVAVKENMPIGQDYVYENPDHLSYCNAWKDAQGNPVGSGTKVRGDFAVYGQKKDNIRFIAESDSSYECTASSLDYLPQDRIAVVPKEHGGASVSKLGEGLLFSKPVKAIYLPKSIKTIEANNFSCCTLLETINFEGTEQEWNAIENLSKDNIPDHAVIHFETPFNG